MATTPEGVQYPTGVDTHPSASWWAQLAASTSVAIKAAQAAAVSSAASSAATGDSQTLTSAKSYSDAQLSSARQALETALAGKSDTGHTHNASAITAGTFPLARLPVATSGTSSTTQLVRADDSRLSNQRDTTRAKITDATTLGRTLLGAADAAAGRSALDAAPAQHEHPAAQISDATPLGRQLLTTTESAAVRSALGIITDEDLGTTDLDNVTTPGTYRQPNGPSATLARHYPVEGYLGTLEVRTISSTSYVEQTFTRAVSAPGVSQATTWIRYRWAGVWRPWERQPDSTTHLPASVDTSVGTRVFVGGVMVHGDTGWRRVPELLTDDWGLQGTVPACDLRRMNDRVTLVLRLSRVTTGSRGVGSSPVMNLPYAFQPWSYTTLGYASIDDYPMQLTSLSVLSRLDVRGARGNPANYVGGEALSVELSWTTRHGWPSTLPGTPL